MSQIKIALTKDQAEFIMKMTELNNPTEAMRKFAKIMTSEGVDPSEMPRVIDIIMRKMVKK